jgi:hypothetical protein
MCDTHVSSKAKGGKSEKKTLTMYAAGLIKRVRGGTQIVYCREWRHIMCLTGRLGQETECDVCGLVCRARKDPAKRRETKR